MVATTELWLSELLCVSVFPKTHTLVWLESMWKYGFFVCLFVWFLTFTQMDPPTAARQLLFE